MSELFDIHEIPEGKFPINFNIIYLYQQKYPGPMESLKVLNIKQIYFGAGNTILNIITFDNKICIPTKLQIYVIIFYHKYLLRPETGRTEAMIFQNLYWSSL